MYKVIKMFTDLQDNCYEYNVGDTFPRDGFEVDEERIAELMGNENKQGVPLLEVVEEPVEEPVEEEKPRKKSSKN